MDEAEDEIEENLDKNNNDEEIAAVLKSKSKSRPVSSKSTVVPLDPDDGVKSSKDDEQTEIEKPKCPRRRLIRAKTLNDIVLVIYGFIFVFSVIVLVAHLANTINQSSDSQAPKGVTFSPLKTYNAKID